MAFTRGGLGPTANHGAYAAALVLVALYTAVVVEVEGAGNWCIARSAASQTALQTALDYACGAGADCTPVLSSGLCYLPNTLQAHASYAFNSYYQRSNYAPGSCDFAGTATLTISDPSYGSCTYPASPSAAGGAFTPPSTATPILNPPTTPATNMPGTVPTTFPANGTTSPTFGGGIVAGGGGLSPGFGSTTTDTSGTGSNSTYLQPLLMIFAAVLLLPLFF